MSTKAHGIDKGIPTGGMSAIMSLFSLVNICSLICIYACKGVEKSIFDRIRTRNPLIEISLCKSDVSLKSEKSTAPGIPRRSPIQVLTGPDVAWLQWSDENWYFQRGMAVDTKWLLPKGCYADNVHLSNLKWLDVLAQNPLFAMQCLVLEWLVVCCAYIGCTWDVHGMTFICFQNRASSLPGFEPGIFWSVVRRVIHCATSPGTNNSRAYKRRHQLEQMS